MSLLTGDEKVQSLQAHWRDGVGDLIAFEHLLIQVIDSGAWKSFLTPNGKPVKPLSFRQFITDKPYEGLGATPEKIMKLLGDDNDTVVEMRKLLEGKPGRPLKGKARSKQSTDNISRLTGQGTRRDYTLDRLMRERPDLRARVDAEELFANAAAIEAGFRPRSITLRLTTSESIAATLKRQLAPDILRGVAKLLTAEE